MRIPSRIAPPVRVALTSTLLIPLVMAVACSRSAPDAGGGADDLGSDSGSGSGSGGFPIEAGKYTVLGILTDNQDLNQAKGNAEATLLRHPDVGCLVGLWSNNTPMILAALRSSDAVGDVAVVGFDEHPDTLAGIREGSVHGTIVQQPYSFGYRSVEWLTSLAKGVPVELPESRQRFIPHRAITAENVREFANEVEAIKSGNGPLLSPDSELDGDGVEVAFITNSIDPFWTLAEFGCRQAAKQFGTTVDVQMPATGTIEEQKRYLESNAAAGIDGVAISPIDPDNQVGMINEACEAMTVICQDSDAPASNRKFYLGTSNYMAGRAAGKLIKEALPDGGSVMMFVGKMEVLNAKERSQGIIDELSDAPLPPEFAE